MNEQEKQEYREQYAQAKSQGVPFFPDVIFKDAVVTLLVFLILVGLAYFVGAPLEARANPADTSYTPRPEWYFLFLFQMLKYFPGKYEFIGVTVIPTLAIVLLFVLPFLDRSPRRHFVKRPAITGITSLAIIGIGLLTFQAVRETPPPADQTQGDQVAALYAQNCASCHGPTVTVKEGTNLHAVIAGGKHEGMPAWSGDLTSDQIDALVGFILSPAGSQLFTENCAGCHAAPELVAGNPLELKDALAQGPSFPAHAGLDVPEWKDVLSPDKQIALLNFLAAPDGQRLFAINCSPCHGRAVAFSGDEQELRTLISQGGLHLEMPPWQGKLSETDLDTLASYVVDPAANPAAASLFEKNCAACHGQQIPAAVDVEKARQTIAQGGAHVTMPVWGQILTPEQLDALASYTLSASQGTPVALGQQLFAKNCVPCHGDFGEGGANPTHPGDIIAPISTGEYLKTRDDFTLLAIISQGQPNFGMSPFGNAFGGPLDDEEVSAIVAYIRSWEANPPVELPPEVSAAKSGLSGAEVFADVCAQCHGASGEGGIGPAFNTHQFKTSKTDQDIFDSINLGHEATAMIAWGEILSSDQIDQLVDFIRQLPEASPQPTVAATQTNPTPPASPTPEPTAGPPSFSKDVLPILEAKCVPCHGSMGGWDASSYTGVMESGDNSPVVIPGDPDASLLMQKLLGKDAQAKIMPPGGPLPEEELTIFQQWIATGALDN